jgi:hypothetical protein
LSQPRSGADFEKQRRARFHQRLGELLPDAFGGQSRQFAAGRDLAQQRSVSGATLKPNRAAKRASAARAADPRRMPG